MSRAPATDAQTKRTADMTPRAAFVAAALLALVAPGILADV